MTTKTRWRVLTALIIALALSVGLAPGPTRAQDLDLVAKAKAEGKVVYYTSWDSVLAQTIADAFTAKYGVAVEIFRAGGAQIGQKIALELRTRQVNADVVEINEPTFPMLLAKQGSLLKYKIKNAEGLKLPLTSPDNSWHPTAVLFVGLVYNTKLLTKDQVPTSYKDLADPRWKGKLVWASPNYGSPQLAAVKALVEIGGWELIEGLAKNQTMVIRAFPEAENAVASGERLVGADSSNRASTALRRGEPLALIYPKEGVIAVPAVTMIMKDAKHPNAAKLYQEFSFSEEAQRIYVRLGAHAVREGLGAPPQLKPKEEMRFYHINWPELLDTRDEVARRWTQIMER